jgi:hypothetical protein
MRFTGSGSAGGQSRACSTAPRICSNHQTARLNRPAFGSAGLSPGLLPNTISSWRLTITHLSVLLGQCNDTFSFSQAAVLMRHPVSENERMHSTDAMNHYSTKGGTNSDYFASLRL